MPRRFLHLVAAAAWLAMVLVVPKGDRSLAQIIDIDAGCTQTARAPSFRIPGRFDWYFKSNNIPTDVPEVQVDNARDGFRDGTAAITQEKNDCLRGDTVSATSAFQGDLNDVVINVPRTGGCLTSPGDDTSLSGWGTLDSVGGLEPAGKTCRYFPPDPRPFSSDMKLNPDIRWYVNLGANCNNKWSVRGVVTHERGHTFGGVNDTHGNIQENAQGDDLTFSPEINHTCDGREETLGLGDMLALESIY